MRLRCSSIAAIHVPHASVNPQLNTSPTMTTTKKIAAFIIILITCFPMVMVLNNGPSVLPNFIGTAYVYLYFKYGHLIAPKFVMDYLAYLEKQAKE